MATRQRLNYAQMTNTKKSDVIQWDELMRRAVRELFGRHARIRTAAFITQQDKAQFLKLLFSDARNVDPREPEEISKNTVDVNEKVYYNREGSEDETTVKIVNCVENAEGHNYTQSTTKGVEWGVDSNVGLQFGLPQVGASGGFKIGANFKRTTLQTQTEEKTKSNRVELQSHHEETVKIPPGKKAVVRMTSYRVRYKLEYTMEYKIAKTAVIRVSLDPCGLGLPCTSQRGLTARDLLQYLPGFREDEEFVYFTQDGELRWIADRMEVDKKIVSLDN